MSSEQKNKRTRDIYIARETSWLRFNERVLLQADADEVPLLERLRFAAIFTSNLDEFFMVRAGSLSDRALLPDVPPDNKTGLTAAEQLNDLYRDARRLYALRDRIYEKLTSLLAEHGIVETTWNELSKDEKKQAKQFFKKELAPLTSPYIIDAHHPFPHLENKLPHILLTLHMDEEKTLYGIVPVPQNAPKLLCFKDESSASLRYISTVDIVYHEIDELYKRYSVKSKFVIKVTRNADIAVVDNFSDDPEHELDYMAYLKILLKKREKLGAIRLEYRSSKKCDSDKSLSYLLTKLGLEKNQLYRSVSPISYGFAGPLIREASAMLDELVYRAIPPTTVAAGEIFARLDERDILLVYPYNSMRTYLDFLREAVFDSRVQSIRITLYRLAQHSEIISLLRTAAEMGKAVTAVVELKARFDEENNIHLAELLEESGAHVIYGMNGLKVHSKVTLVTLKDEDGIKRYAHIGTGNYNEQTAKLYTDLGILTADKILTADADELFRSLINGIPSDSYKSLLVSPTTLKPRILAEIEREKTTALAGHGGYICMKMNSMTDKCIIDALADASAAGVRIDLIIRGICCLRAGVAGKTDNIRVISLVGRFLEHSRIFIFGKCDGNIKTAAPRVYIGSADMMTRNTERRIEVIAPILDRDIADKLIEITRRQLADNVKASEMQVDGTYKKIESYGVPHDSQIELFML